MDGAVIGTAWLASFWFRFYVPVIEVTKGFPAFSRYAALTPLIVVLWAVIFDGHGVYDAQKSLHMESQVWAALRAHVFALLTFVALTYVFSEYRYSRVVVVFFGVLGAFGVVLGRLLLRSVFRGLRRYGFQAANVLLVGDGTSLDLLVDRIDENPELGVDVVGVLLPENASRTEVRGKRVLGHFGEVAKTAQARAVDKVLIALPRPQWTELDRILDQIKDETLDIQIVPDLHDYATIGCAVEDFAGLPVVSLNESPLLGWRAAFKRITDVVLSAVALIAGAPLFLTLAVAVKATSRGPVFYRQERMGLDGRTFKMFKFRSMRVDAESSTGAVWARQGDDRRTPIGAFLRATSLDEIPQFWNVFLGHMSLVGPRPERPVFVNQFRHQISHYMLRHRVRAGVTGWAQVNGWRGNTSLDERILCDLYYIRHWSYLFDVKILFLTVWKGFVNKNAY
ncbi:MAG TPA: undecaprenyl-phosphate glucose phosphotransferase [Polyangia bacterium]|nr:undecaprenyl-phosphate glucose phosphotransferase [Polyangia bacterium]